MKKLFKVLAVLLLALSVGANGFAATGFRDNDGNPQAVADINIKGCTNSVSEGIGTIDCRTISGTSATYTGDVTFRSNLVSVGRYGASVSSLSSSSTNLSATSIAYAVITKFIGGGGGLDGDGRGSILANGTPGQVLTFIVVGAQSGGTWVITPTTKTGFRNLTFNALGDQATLLYVNDTVGWIVVALESVTVS